MEVDAGDYKCTASNDAGSVSELIIFFAWEAKLSVNSISTSIFLASYFCSQIFFLYYLGYS